MIYNKNNDLQFLGDHELKSSSYYRDGGFWDITRRGYSFIRRGQRANWWNDRSNK